MPMIVSETSWFTTRRGLRRVPVFARREIARRVGQSSAGFATRRQTIDPTYQVVVSLASLLELGGDLLNAVGRERFHFEQA